MSAHTQPIPKIFRGTAPKCQPLSTGNSRGSSGLPKKGHWAQSSFDVHQRRPKFAPKMSAKHDVRCRPSGAAQDQSDIHCQFPPQAQVKAGVAATASQNLIGHHVQPMIQCQMAAHPMSSLTDEVKNLYLLMVKWPQLGRFYISNFGWLYPHSWTQLLVDKAFGIQTNSMEGPCFTSSSSRVKPDQFTARS